jgi:Family of unknown function (DUF5694)
MNRPCKGWSGLLPTVLLSLVAVPVAFAAGPVVPLGKPAFDPRSVRSEIAGTPTQVLVIGTLHLSSQNSRFNFSSLAPVLDRLAAFQPQVITIEAMPAQLCDLAVRYAASYPGVAKDYCASTAVAAKSTGLDVAAAEAEVLATLAAWRRPGMAAPTPAQRRRLAAVFAAANDRSSALVQWLRLPGAERIAADGIDAELLELLNASLAKSNENYQIAAVLAARLGLERVHASDDHTADSVFVPLGKEFEAAIQEVWDRPTPYKDTYLKGAGALTSGDAVLAFYRYLNSPEGQRGAIEVDQLAAAKHATPAQYGRQYLAWWETRNLRMVANIRAAAANQPGARVLSIVGASHKPYVDAYLDLMQDVVIVDAAAILK